jgi:hypothetical protein
MSDIIYNPPATGGGGGTTINPTNNYIPVRSNATTFVDSILYNDFTNYRLFATNNLNQRTGLDLDINNNNFQFGELTANYQGFTNLIIQQGNTEFFDIYQGISLFQIINTLSNGIPTKLVTDVDNQLIKTQNNNNNIGLTLDFATDLYSFADFNSVSSGTSFYIDVASSLIYTKHSGQQEGLFFDFVNDYFQIGDFAGTNNGTYLTIDDDNTFIQTYFGGVANGLKLDLHNKTYFFGDFNITNNGTNFIIDDASIKMTFTTDYLNFVGLPLTNGATPIPASKNLVVTINGGQYLIPLYT